MEFASFTCQFCAEHQEWDAPRPADAVWHVFHARPGRWFAVPGDTVPTDPQPTRLGHRQVRL